MLRDVRATVASIPANLVRALALLLSLTAVGVVGYIVIEGWSFLDALYMTVIVLITIGFGETRPLDTESLHDLPRGVRRRQSLLHTHLWLPVPH